MRQQPLLTGLTIASTALAICLIMLVIMTREAKLVDYGCEPNRSRTLYIKSIFVKGEHGNKTYSGGLRRNMANGLSSNLKSAEKVALFSAWLTTVNAALPGGEFVKATTKAVNADFFDVFPLRFIEGRPFTKEECNSGLPLAILSRTTCRKVFRQEKGVTGKTFLVDNYEYRVAGVVEDVSSIQKSAYAEMWVPGNNAGTAAADVPSAHISAPSLDWEYNIAMAILARNSDDFTAIRNEVDRNLAVFNKSFSPDTLNLMQQPDTQEMYVSREYSNQIPDIVSIRLRYALIIAIMLIVPAINIASMMQSRLRQRRAELGVRRAFGAKRSTILLQTVMESFLQTLAAGILGLILCFALCVFAGDYVFASTDIFASSQKVQLDMSILFSPEIYGWTLLFCLILNMLSITVPAWRVSRENIVEAIK